MVERVHTSGFLSKSGKEREQKWQNWGSVIAQTTIAEMGKIQKEVLLEERDRKSPFSKNTEEPFEYIPFQSLE